MLLLSINQKQTTNVQDSLGKPSNSALVLDAGGLCHHLSLSIRLTPK